MIGTKEAARRLGVDTSTVRRWIETGKLKAVRIGQRSWAIEEQDLAAFERPSMGRPTRQEKTGVQGADDDE